MDPASPRIAAVKSRLQRGDNQAADELWEELEQSGTPLIERTDPSNELLVTLLTRQSDATRLSVVGGLSGLDPTDARMRRLGGSQLWYRTYRAPANLRTVYAFAPSKAADDPNRWTADPLNPRTFLYPADPEAPDDPEARVSVLDLPDAPPFRWSVSADAPQGATTLHRLRSARLGNERRVYAYTPAGYDESEDGYPFLVIFDGWAFTQLVSAPATLDHLIAANAIPKVVAILPDSLDNPTRMRELWLDDGFNAFIADELLPWARARLRLSDDPQRVTIAGSSLGGVAATYFALQRPDIARNVISMSGAFQISPAGEPEPIWLGRELASRDRAPVRFWLDAGTLERLPDLQYGVSILAANRHVRDTLTARGYEVHYREFPGGHDYFWWAETLGEALVALN
ncbi:MAG: alpha/beta hydrolase-fold protein [Chloroflexota bacterium]|nr:alpha/beta hydrolase-fold protein [Chloroflexota bacterium]